MTSEAHGKIAAPRLIIFGCGYVGAAVAETALASGIEVTAVTRNAAKAELLRAAGIRTVVADLASDAWHDAVGEAPDFALNSVGSGGNGVEGYRHSYLAGAASITRWARAHGPVGTLIYTSSTSVYPQSDGAVVGEDAPTGGDERASILVEAERSFATAEGAWGRWFVLRLAGIYGPARHHVLDQVRRGEVTGTGEHRLNIAHRDDIVAAIWACFRAPAAIRNRIFNVADDSPAPKREIVEWLAQHVNPGGPVRFTGQPMAGRRATALDRIIANRTLKSVLGWELRYPSFREGYAALLGRPE
jgi:nucleoside-diphosphate-sugar epimerase